MFVEALPRNSPNGTQHRSPGMGVTIYDLAREAGVGIGTVSRCLNSHPNVAPDTRARVLAVIKRLNYQPHAQAQRLASRHTNTIALIIPSFTNYFFVQVLQGVQDLAADAGLDLILYGVNHPSQIEHYVRRSLHRGLVDGLLFFSMKFPDSLRVRARQSGLPIVMVDAFHPDFDSIRVENREGARIATDHLIALGHRSIAMINASLETQPAQDRLKGFQLALREHDIPFSMDRVYVSAIGKQDGFNREAGSGSMRNLLADARCFPEVTAAFVASDVQALGALEVAREQGVRVPEDLAIVGFDDIELAQFAELTTMRQPMYTMGRLAMQRLMDRIKHPDAPVKVTTYLPELIVRKSCGARLRSASRMDAPESDAAVRLPQSLPHNQGVNSL